MNHLRVLIVDDEPLVRQGIRRGLSALEGIEIIGECGSGFEAVTAISSQRPDLVLLDVQLQDSTGLDVVAQIGPQNMPPVIFITAYDEYAVKAFELNAVDYVLKPFDDERLTSSIRRAQERIAARKQSFLGEQLEALLDFERKRWPQRIVVKNGERFDIVATEAIDWIESANNYVQLHCGPRQYTLGETLTSLENRLDPQKFVRIHRGRIVNLARLTAVHAMLGGTYEIELRSGERLSSGRQYKDAIQAIIKSQA
jgi:two-component system LytT family response regulator